MNITLLRFHLLAIFASCAFLGCQKNYPSHPSPIIGEWQSRFKEFNGALQAYRNRSNYFEDEKAGSENRMLFPESFAELAQYGLSEGRSHLKTEDDFRKFQDSITIDVENEKYFEVKNIDIDSWLAKQTRILHKDVKNEAGTEMTIFLTYGGDVFYEPKSLASQGSNTMRLVP